MLVLSRRVFEKIYIGDDIVITICEIRENSVRIGIDAPKHMNIARQELIDDTIVSSRAGDEFDVKVPYQQAGFDDVVDLGRRPTGEIEAGFVDGSAVIEDAI